MTAGPTSNQSAPPATRPSTAAPPATARRAAVALIAVAWCAGLTWLVLTTSNPVTLNRLQILEADEVVTATIEDRDSGRCRIIRQWTGEALRKEIVVDGLSKTAAQSQGEWILPLVELGEELQIVPSRLPSRARLVYPATPEAVAQLETILDSRE